VAGLKPDPRAVALRHMRDASSGKIPRRSPIIVKDGGDGLYYVIDGNATVQVLMLAKWEYVVVQLVR
jgi:hypothetical protein